MRPGIAAVFAVACALAAGPARAQGVASYYVHCIDGRIAVEQWDEDQMKVRRGSNVCQLRRHTSYSSALDWADKNFGGRGSKCSC